MSQPGLLTVTIVYEDKSIKMNPKKNITLKEIKDFAVKEFKLEKNFEKYITFFFEDDDGDMNLIENDKDIKKFKTRYSSDYLIKLKLMLIEKENLTDRENNNKKFDKNLLRESTINNKIINNNSDENSSTSIKEQSLEEKKKQLHSKIKKEKENNKKELEKIKSDYDKKIKSIMHKNEEEIASLKKKLSELKKGNNNMQLQETSSQQDKIDNRITENITGYINEILNNYDMESEIKEIDNIFDNSTVINEMKQKLEKISNDLKNNNQQFVNKINEDHKKYIQDMQNLENNFKNISKNFETEETSFISKKSNNRIQNSEQTFNNDQNNKIRSNIIIKKKSDSNKINSKNSKEIEEEPKDNNKKKENKLPAVNRTKINKKKENKDNNQDSEDNTIDNEEKISNEGNGRNKIKKFMNDKNSLNKNININKENNGVKKQSEELNSSQNDLSPSCILKQKEESEIAKPKIINKQNNNQKKKAKKGYELIKTMFFIDNEFKKIKMNEPYETDYKKLLNEIDDERDNGDTILKTHCLNFIKTNVISSIRKIKDDNLKKKITKRMEYVLRFCCGVNGNIFQDLLENQTKNIKYDRKKSVEAAKKFRAEFNISEEVYSDEALIRRLEENDLDIHKTFQYFYD